MDDIDDDLDSMHTWWQRLMANRAARITLMLAAIVAIATPLTINWFNHRRARTPTWVIAEEELPVQPIDPVHGAWFEPSEHFAPLPEPGQGDWLWSHPEPGQSYNRYIHAEPNLPGQQRHTLYILPVGDFPSNGPFDLELIARACALYFGMPVAILPVWQPTSHDITRRTQDSHEQWLTDDVLDGLKTRLPEDAYGMLGVTMTDIWPGKGWNYVFGQASLRERVGIQSFARYTPNLERDANALTTEQVQLMRLRAIKVMTHEFGHMFGMRHCTAYHCNMNGSNHLAESDAQPLSLCPVCLRKLQHAVGFEPDARYQALDELYTSQNLLNSARWVRARRAEVLRAVSP